MKFYGPLLFLGFCVFESSGDAVSNAVLSNLMDKWDQMERKIARQDLEIQYLREKVEHSSSKRLLMPDNENNSTSVNVAFYAHLSKNIDNIGNHQTIIFDTVRFNQGNGYKSVDGEFRAAIPGTYFFIWTISNADATYMQSEIIKNGEVYGQIISDSGNHNDWAVSTSFAVLSLDVDDRVWIRSRTVHSGHVNGVGFGTSSFAGFRLG